MNKTEKLKLAYNKLKEGNIIEFISDEGKMYNCRCWIQKSEVKNRYHIHWRCFGQSANRMNISNLRWIAKTIAKCTTYDFNIVNSIY